MKHSSSKRIIYGIQGGKGSFNEEAIHYYLKREGISRYRIKYLYTAENVLRAIEEGTIDRGQLAIHNSAGGIVDESIEALARYKCEVVEKFAIKISHALMMRNDAKPSDITAIMTHPQVLAQCRRNLQKKYPKLIQTSGKGKLIDHALVAKKLGEKKLPKSVATMGSRILAELYHLTVVEDRLEDLKENYTSFLQVGRPHSQAGRT
ncbi:MAG: hypothetical protein A2946_01425 [Candidatus Liptonbacteria bacterium RIFCSPLOWO2_01_FULL_53_13]|uniref:prephenate dehydratase n=1 Tax=Candidatus Liptonbacteria bacterium RIFCSPLOWO2_01_FULL_53_13 TaxID=1798651 RepID=A0A1G2CJX7_9BACT|nr:MAG: hypothetical protein A2946_01425 [Candidatus Liptonbacteria bacterium RIFCSPLOWO2_01_FULL_53_13]